MNGDLLRTDEGEIATPYPAILTPEQSQALHVVLKPDPTRPKKTGRHPARLLSTFLSCPGCPNFLTVARRQKSPVFRCQTRSQGGTCEQPVSISAPQIEEYVSGVYIQKAGWLPYFREEVRVSNAGSLALVEADIAEAARELASAATAEVFARLQRLQARRDELMAEVPEQLVTLVDTGMTCAEIFQAAIVDDQRAMLRQAFDEIVILPGKPGSKKLDPNRVILRWTPDDPTDQVD